MSEATSEKKRLPLRPGAGFRIPEEPGAKPYLYASRCGNCGKHFVPRRVICLNCNKQEMTEVALAGTGTLYAFTIVHHQVPGILLKVPYALSIIGMDEGCAVRTVVTDGCESLKIDEKMEVYFEKAMEDSEGNDLMVCKFKAVK